MKKRQKKRKFHRLTFTGTTGEASVDVNDYLEKGKKLLAAGQLVDALSQFHSAIGMLINMKYVCLIKVIC